MSDIKRFEITEEEFPVRESKSGDYVYYDDYKELQTELAESRVELGLMAISRDGLKERLKSCEAALNARDIELAKSKAECERLTESIEFKDEIINDLQSRDKSPF